MYCWSCGYKNADENKYCAECGKKQVHPSAEEMSESASDSAPPGSQQRRQNPVDPAKGPQRIRLTDPLVEYPAPKPPAGMFKRRASDYIQPPRERRVIAAVPEPIPSDFGLHPSAADQPLSSNGMSKPSNPLVTEPGAVHEKLVAHVAPPSTPSRVEAPVPSKPAPNRVSGPSFLGLNDAPSTTSDDASYLLDDDSESSSSWPAVLALTLLIVFGVVLVKEWGPIHYFATTELQKAGINIGDQPTKRPANDAAHHPPAAVSAGDVTPDAGTVSSESNPTKTGNKDQLAGKSSDAANGKVSEKLPMPESDSAASASKDAKTKSAEPADVSDTSTRTSKPSPNIADETESKKTYDNSQIQLAEKYIYGRGVPQDCGRALTLLRSAAGTQNPNAQIKLGALYATGQCVSQDRALAYGWYSRAKRIEPGNTFLEYSMNSLWASMTEDERRRAQSL